MRTHLGRENTVLVDKLRPDRNYMVVASLKDGIYSRDIRKSAHNQNE